LFAHTLQVETKSIHDTDFAYAFHFQVHCGRFFSRVNEMARDPISPLTVFWELASGRVLCASQNTISVLRKECYPPPEETLEAFKSALLEWRQQYLMIAKNPKEACKDMPFDIICDWAVSFFYLTPIIDLVYLRDLHERLVQARYKVIDFASLCALKNKGLMSCGCKTYLHRAFCVHCCADAFRKGILTQFPSDPEELKGRGQGAVMKSNPNGKSGAKRKANNKPAGSGSYTD
jgi:hypothetical protein